MVNVTPRYAKLRDSNNKVFGWQVSLTPEGALSATRMGQMGL